MSVPADTAKYCEEMANFGENSYVFYAKCLRIELETFEIIGQQLVRQE